MYENVFQAADVLWNGIWDLRVIVVGAINEKS
jgi:hypothetical protein